jgi:hypothetical protein
VSTSLRSKRGRPSRFRNVFVLHLQNVTGALLEFLNSTRYLLDRRSNAAPAVSWTSEESLRAAISGFWTSIGGLGGLEEVLSRG